MRKRHYLALCSTIGAGAGAATNDSEVGSALYFGSARNFGAGSSPVQQPQDERTQKLTAATGMMISLNKVIVIIVNYYLYMTTIECDDKKKQISSLA
jgi:hypothetical protein